MIRLPPVNTNELIGFNHGFNLVRTDFATIHRIDPTRLRFHKWLDLGYPWTRAGCPQSVLRFRRLEEICPVVIGSL